MQTTNNTKYSFWDKEPKNEEKKDIEIPAFLDIYREITDEPEYLEHNMAKKSFMMNPKDK